MKHTERNTMTMWNNFKEKISSINQSEMTILALLALLHAERIKKGISQAELAKK